MERVIVQAMPSVLQRRTKGKERGFSLVELMIVLALIGLSSTLSAVSLSSNDAKLRSFARDLRFNLEKAKHEALASPPALSASAPTPVVFVEFFNEAPSFDCDGDGEVNAKDRCYVLYLDRDGVEGFDPGADPKTTDQLIKQVMLPSSMLLSGGAQLEFSPFGGCQAAELEAKTWVRTDYRQCASRCLYISYLVTVHRVGRIQIGEKDETCASCTVCDSCS